MHTVKWDNTYNNTYNNTCDKYRFSNKSCLWLYLSYCYNVRGDKTSSYMITMTRYLEYNESFHTMLITKSGVVSS